MAIVETSLPRPSVRSLLALRDYRLLVIGTALVWLVSPLQIVTQVFWAQERFPDDDVRIAAMLAGSRGAALIIFSFVGGAIADRFERRRILLATESAAVCLHAVIAIFMITVPFGAWTVAPVAGLTFLASGVLAIDLPARQASLPAIVGMERLPTAISFNTLAMQIASGLGLPISGMLNGAIVPGWAYAASLLSWLFVLPLIAALRYESQGVARSRNMLANVVEGARYSAHHAIILGVVATMFVAMVVGMPAIAIPFGPLWITDELGQSEQAFGFIAMTWGLGAIGGAWLATRVGGLSERGMTVLAALALSGLAIVVFGSVKMVPGAISGNILHGFSFAILNATSATIVQQRAIDEMRGRVMGLFPLMQGVSQVAVVFYGELAQRELVQLAVLIPSLGWLTFLLALGIAASFPGLRSARGGEPSPSPAPAPAGGG